MILDPLVAGGTAAAAWKALSFLEAYWRGRNGNGNGRLPSSDHDTLMLTAQRIEQGFDTVHSDLVDIKTSNDRNTERLSSEIRAQDRRRAPR